MRFKWHPKSKLKKKKQLLFLFKYKYLPEMNSWLIKYLLIFEHAFLTIIVKNNYYKFNTLNTYAEGYLL